MIELPIEQAPLAEAAQDRPADGNADILVVSPQVDADESAAPETAELHRLARAVEDLARVAELREQHFVELHRDNQRLRNEADGRAALPILRDLIMHFDQLRAAGLDDWADNVAIILERYDVERYDVEPGESFSPTLHRGVRSIPAPEGVVDKTIARTLRPGFRFNGRPLRAAEVEVYRASLPSGA